MKKIAIKKFITDKQLKKIEKIIADSSDVEESFDKIEMLLSDNFTVLDLGTNRLVLEHEDYKKKYVVKVAGDDHGIEANYREYYNGELDPKYLVQSPSISKNGVFLVQERVKPFNSGIMAKRKNEVVKMLEHLEKKLLLVDCKLSNFKNFGLRDDKVVLLDHGDTVPLVLYEDGKQVNIQEEMNVSLRCRAFKKGTATSKHPKPCGGKLIYTDDYSLLYCTKCGITVPIHSAYKAFYGENQTADHIEIEYTDGFDPKEFKKRLDKSMKSYVEDTTLGDDEEEKQMEKIIDGKRCTSIGSYWVPVETSKTGSSAKLAAVKRNEISPKQYLKWLNLDPSDYKMTHSDNLCNRNKKLATNEKIVKLGMELVDEAIRSDEVVLSDSDRRYRSGLFKKISFDVIKEKMEELGIDDNFTDVLFRLNNEALRTNDDVDTSYFDKEAKAFYIRAIADNDCKEIIPDDEDDEDYDSFDDEDDDEKIDDVFEDIDEDDEDDGYYVNDDNNDKTDHSDDSDKKEIVDIYNEYIDSTQFLNKMHSMIFGILVKAEKSYNADEKMSTFRLTYSNFWELAELSRLYEYDSPEAYTKFTGYNNIMLDIQDKIVRHISLLKDVELNVDDDFYIISSDKPLNMMRKYCGEYFTIFCNLTDKTEFSKRVLAYMIASPDVREILHDKLDLLDDTITSSVNVSNIEIPESVLSNFKEIIMSDTELSYKALVALVIREAIKFATYLLKRAAKGDNKVIKALPFTKFTNVHKLIEKYEEFLKEFDNTEPVVENATESEEYNKDYYKYALFSLIENSESTYITISKMDIEDFDYDIERFKTIISDMDIIDSIEDHDQYIDIYLRKSVLKSLAELYLTSDDISSNDFMIALANNPGVVGEFKDSLISIDNLMSLLRVISYDSNLCNEIEFAVQNYEDDDAFEKAIYEIVAHYMADGLKFAIDMGEEKFSSYSGKYNELENYLNYFLCYLKEDEMNEPKAAEHDDLDDPTQIVIDKMMRTLLKSSKGKSIHVNLVDLEDVTFTVTSRKDDGTMTYAKVNLYKSLIKSGMCE